MKRIAHYLIRFAFWLAPDIQAANRIVIVAQPHGDHAYFKNCMVVPYPTATSVTTTYPTANTVFWSGK